MCAAAMYEEEWKRGVSGGAGTRDSYALQDELAEAIDREARGAESRESNIQQSQSHT